MRGGLFVRDRLLSFGVFNLGAPCGSADFVKGKGRLRSLLT
jgi:hypothetical protein